MKRILLCMLIMALLATVALLPVSAKTEATQTVTPAVTCPHCDKDWDACNWEPFEPFEDENAARSGHFYLTEDTELTSLCGIGLKDGQSSEYAVDVCLDLRGFDFVRTTSNTRAIYVYDYSRMDVLDSVGGGTVSSASTVIGGTVYVAGGGQFHLHSGTLRNTSTSARTANGGVIYGTTGSNVYIHGGIVDATAVKGSTSSGTPRGGAIYNSGICEISGGLILGGFMNQGGALAVSSDGTLRISGGTVYGGRAKSHGGNLHNFGDTYISGGEILGGVSETYGGNIYSSYSSNGKVSDLHISGGYIADGQAPSAGNNISLSGGNGSVTGGHVKGDFYANTALVLSGSPVIDNCGYEGLYVNTGKKIVIRDLADDARIILRSSGAVTEASASPNAPQYLEKGLIQPTSRYSLTVTDGALVGGQDDEGYCPHCQKNVTWTAYTATTNTSGHYYVPSGGITPSAEALTIAAGTDIVLNVSNGNINTTASYNVDGTLSILSTASSRMQMTNTTSVTTTGGVLRVTGTLNLYDCYIKGTTSTVSGAAIYVKGGKMNMYGGMIFGGNGKNGANIYADGSAVIRMDGGVIHSGVASNSGGNIYLESATLNLNRGVIAGGTAKSNGGNIQPGSSGVLNMRGGMVLKGTATSYGGNVYTAATSSKVNLYDGKVLLGNAKSGGNIYANNGALKVTGGEILSGTATSSGGNVYTIAGKYFITNGGDLKKNYMNFGDDATDEIPAPVISGGRAQYGGNIFVGGISTIGNVTLTGGRADSGQDLYLGESGRLTVDPGFTGTHKMALHSTRLTELREKSILSYCTSTQLNATLIVENYDNAMLVATDGNLGMAGASLVSIADGSQVWFETAQAAVDACRADTYVRLYSKGSTVTLSGDTVVDVNGCHATIQGTGKLYGFDSSNDTFKTFANITLSGVTAEPMFTAPNGNTYVTVADSQGTSFHRVDTMITDVVLRPSAAGIYYKAQFLCDEKLAAIVDTFGIAVSLQDAPDGDFAADADTLYTAFAGSEMGADAANSALITGIFEEGMTAAERKARGEEFLFAKAYMQLTVAGETVTVLSDDLSPWSMRDVLRHLNNYWPSMEENDQKAVMEQIYTPYISDFEDDWGLFYMRYTYRPMTAEEEAILAERRQIVLDYMRESTSVLWTTDQELTYGLAVRDNGTKLRILPGRVYMGVPYAYAVGTQDSFLEYAVGQDEKGIYNITGVEQTALNYESYGARVGNDCSGTVTNAWSQVGTSFTASRSSEMVEAKGAIPIGDYDFCPTINESGNITYTAVVTKTNGEQRIYEAYAQLLPADAVFYVTTSGSNHIRMISEVHIVRNADGTINGDESYVICLEQTRTNQTAVKTKEIEGIGKVYVIGGVDVKYTFNKLFTGGYIPCTIRELRDPTPVEETWITDTQAEHTAQNIFEGNILSNRYIDCVRVTILDEAGNVVQESTGRARRRFNKDFQMSRFVTENPGALRGIVDVAKLDSGKYRCTVTARLTTGDEYTVRDFTFEK